MNKILSSITILFLLSACCDNNNRDVKDIRDGNNDTEEYVGE